MNNSLPDIFHLRNNIEFASIAQFFHTFQSAFRPWPVTVQDVIYSRNLEANDYVFETEDLEQMLLETSERMRLEDLFVRMLRLVSGKRFINASSWQLHFSKEFEKKLPLEENPFVSNEKELVNYFTMPLDTRVHLLYLLCEWQLDEPERFREHLESEQDAVQWRVDPIGYDRKGSTFWLFDDNRLYKETPKPKQTKKIVNRKKKPITPSSRRSSRRNNQSEDIPQEEQSEEEGEWVPWKLVCATKHEWEQFPLKYEKSKNTDEQRFYTLLVNDLIPKIIPVLEEHERQIKKQEAIMHRKRSSRIMIKELEALERPNSYEPESEFEGRSRSSHRIEKKILEKEQQDIESAAKAREERLMERERRIMEREYRALVRNKPSQEPEVQPLPSPVSDVTHNQLSIKMTVKNEKPKKKYKKKEKFDANGNLIPKKEKLDADGNPIPKKKRGRKPKNKDLDEEDWVFDCICGVSGKNLDDGTPMIACESCGVWQHIACLEKSGQIEKQKSLDDVTFICRKCIEQEPKQKKQKLDQQQQENTILLPHIQSTVPSTSSILPPLINDTHVQAQQPLEEPQPPSLEQLSQITARPVPIEPTVTPLIQSASNVQQHITTAGLIPPVDNPICVQPLASTNQKIDVQPVTFQSLTPVTSQQSTTPVLNQQSPTLFNSQQSPTPAISQQSPPSVISQQFPTTMFNQKPIIEQTSPMDITPLVSTQPTVDVPSSTPTQSTVDIPSSPLTLPIVTAPSAPNIQTAAPADTPTNIGTSAFANASAFIVPQP